MLRRMWINQPSTQQPDHDLHGQLVLIAEAELTSGDRVVRAWFAHGDTVSQQVFRMSLSNGWPDHLRKK